jgi:hypothetical protein
MTLVMAVELLIFLLRICEMTLHKSSNSVDLVILVMQIEIDSHLLGQSKEDSLLQNRHHHLRLQILADLCSNRIHQHLSVLIIVCKTSFALDGNGYRLAVCKDLFADLYLERLRSGNWRWEGVLIPGGINLQTINDFHGSSSPTS